METPTFAQLSNDPLRLRTGLAAELQMGDARLVGKADIVFTWVPKPRLRIECQFEPGARIPMGDPDPLLLLEGSDTPIPVHIGEAHASSGPLSQPTRMTMAPRQGAVEMGSGTRLTRVAFSLINFPKLRRHGRIRLEAGDWQVEIWPVEGIDRVIGGLRLQGGYAVTHSGECQQRSGEPFTPDQAEDLLLCLSRFFSFARGFFSPASLPVGYDEDGAVAWEQWGAPHVDPWTYVFSWLDPDHGESLVELLPGFVRMWNDELWRRPLGDAIYWYLRSNNQGAGSDGGIILTQTALELLSWTRLVTAGRELSRDGFRRLPAADQIRMLLARSGVPLGVPQTLTGLSATAKRHGWDAADAFVHVRNSLVHPGGKHEAELSGDAFNEGWLLGLWFLELALLNVLGYRGVYSNRLAEEQWVGAVDRVPWAAESVTVDGSPKAF